jgi:prepilin-type N-terminal cleavage/methylation domain-containing protein
MYKERNMKICFKKGFTLIELLVVVLIIGILATIALPQYQKAVLKSKVSAVFPLLKAAVDAQERHMLATDSYATTFGQLDIQLSDNCSTNTCTFGNNLWLTQNGIITVYLGNNSVNSLTIGMIYDVMEHKANHDNSTVTRTGQILCYDRADNIGSDKFRKVCESFSPTSSYDCCGGKIWVLN